MANEIEISIGEATDLEARVIARYRGRPNATLSGTLRGPFCENSRTLPAEFAFRDLGPRQPGMAEAVVTDPCLWSPEMPHMYQVDVEARKGDQNVAEFHDKIGLRRLTPRRPVDFAPGTG